MKLSDFHEAADLIEERVTLRRSVAEARGAGLGVTLGGRYQDAAIVDAVRGAVITELQRRIATIDGQLARLGVDIDEAIP